MTKTLNNIGDVITYDVAKNIGLGTKEPTKCDFCGKLLYFKGDYIKDYNLIRWHDVPERCTCRAAVTNWMKVDREAQEDLERERQLEIDKKIKDLIFKSKLGERFLTRTFENYNTQDKDPQLEFKKTVAKNRAKKYVENFDKYKMTGQGLIFTGTHGTGKTHLAAAICLELIKRLHSVSFGTVIRLLGRLKETYNDESRIREESILQEYISTELLIIDDLGEEAPSEYTLEKLKYILNARYEKNLPVVITSNYNIDDIEKRLSIRNNSMTAKAIVSRICEMCVGVDMTWNDYRKGN